MHTENFEALCSHVTQSALNASPNIDKRTLLITIDCLGTVLSLLYRLSCCYWGCHGKEHVIEYLSGRSVTSANAAFRLINFGYYDEAFSLIRQISEIGNLMSLFFVEPNHIRKWIDMSDNERKNKYSPLNVRIALEKLGAPVPTDAKQYEWLSSVGTHATPHTIPQIHNNLAIPVLGCLFQEKGFSKTINALAWVVCTVAGPAAKIAIIERTQAERIVAEVIRLAEHL